MKCSFSLKCWHSISSRVRGSSEFSKHLAMFISQADIGLHEALLIERRGSSERGVGLFANHACDSGTAIAVVPNARAVTSTSLSSLGCHYAFNVPSIDAGAQEGITVGMPPNWMGVGLPAATDSSSLLSQEWLDSSSGVLESLLGCTRGQWVELAWRLALERCCAHTYWWGWCDSLPSRAEIEEDRGRVERHVRLQAPHLVSTYTRLRAELNREMADAFARLSATCAVPSQSAFQWAVDVLLSRSMNLVSGPALLASGASPVSLGICPVMDIANGASSSFSVLHNTRMAMDGDSNTSEGDGDVVSQREMLLEARRSVHLSPPGSSRGGSQGSHHTMPNCEVEVATSPCELPIWYRREYLQLPSSLCKADNTEEDFEEAADVGSLTQRKIDMLFPAFVLTTTKSVAAGGELLRHYDAGARTWWKGKDRSPETDLRERLTNQVETDLLLPREFGVTDRGDALALGMMLRYNFSNY